MWVTLPTGGDILQIRRMAVERAGVNRRLRRIPRLAVIVTAAAFTLMPAVAAPQFRPFSSNSHNILEGNWQSCREEGGRYSERVYDHVVNGVAQYEVHLGPRREFALFKGVQDEHRDHKSPENLLKPFTVELDASNQAKHRWEIPSLNVVFTVALAGGSRTDCESWFIVLQPLERTSH
jgi:hypothetical protein